MEFNNVLRWPGASIALLAILVLAGTLSHASNMADARLDPGVVEALSHKSDARLVVRFAASRKHDGEEGYRGVAASVLDRLGQKAPIALRTFRHVPAMVVRADATLVRRLLEDERVTRIGLDAGGGAGLIQATGMVEAPALHQLGWQGEGQTIAVIDSGVDAQNPVFSGRVGPEACFCAGGDGCCPNGDAQQFGVGAANDDLGHGTHVASIALGAEQPARGMAPAAQLVSVKVLDAQNSFCCTSDIVAALDWVLSTQPQVDVVNLSLGTDTSFSFYCDQATAWTQSLADAVDALRERGTLVVAAAMNQGEQEALPVPACLSGVVSVGAVWSQDAGEREFRQGDFACREEARRDQIACFSNTSRMLDLLAPGAPIRAAAPGGASQVRQGTSMAAPIVSGCMALAREAVPQAGPADVLASIYRTGSPVVEQGTARQYPRLSCAEAVAHLSENVGPATVDPAALSGSWYDPSRNGEGWVLEVLENGSAVVFWFTYDLDGEPLWLLGSNGVVDGQRVVFDELVRASGPIFGSLFDPDDFVSEPFGQLELEFEGCDSGRVRWQAPPVYGDGIARVVRLTRLADLPCEPNSAQ